MAERTASRKVLQSVTLAIAFVLLAPIAVMIPLSFTAQSSFIFPPKAFSTRWYENFFTTAEWVYPFWDSVIIGAASATLATIIGTAAAFGIRRLSTRLQLLCVGVLLLPVVVPIVITGVGIYSVFLDWGLVGTYPGFILAHTLYALPLVVVPVMTSLATFDTSLERAAGTLGAAPFGVFRQISLPLVMPGVAAGAVFAFVQSWDEIVISIFISTPSLTTMPVRMYNAVASDVDPTLAAASSLIITVVVLAVFLTFFVNSRKKENHA